MSTIVSIGDNEYSAVWYSDILVNQPDTYTANLCLIYHDLGTSNQMRIPHYLFPLIHPISIILPYDQILKFCLKAGCGLVEGQLLYLFTVISPGFEPDTGYVIHLKGYESRMVMWLKLLNNDEWENRNINDFVIHLQLLDDDIHQRLRVQYVRTRTPKFFTTRRTVTYLPFPSLGGNIS